jgi:hypothetical protein
MKTIPTAVLALTALLLAGAASGQAVKATTAVSESKTASSSAHMGQIDAHMKRMQELHVKLNNATTQEERQKLMDAQRLEMHQGMAMMQTMSHDGASMGGAGADMKGHTGKPADQKMQMQMMERRMDMMQTMMQTMMDQQGASASGPMPALVK